MRFAAVLRFELAYQLRRAWPWLIALSLLVLSYLVARENALAEALFDEFYVNSPFSIAKTTVVCSLFWLLLGAAISGEAAARDWSTGMAPLTFTTPLSKAEFLGGRLVAALLLNALLLAVVQLGIIIAVYVAPTDPAVMGPFRPEAHLTAYAYVALPTVVLSTVLQYVLATRTGRPMSAYVGSVLVILMSIVVASALLYRSPMGELLDVIGMRFILSKLSHDWTSVEKSVRLLRFDGALAQNRLLWLGVSAVLAGIGYQRFRMAHRVVAGWRWLPWRPRRAAAPDASDRAIATGESVEPVQARRRFGAEASWRQVLATAAISFTALLRSWPAAVLLLFIPAVTVLIVADQLSAFGVPILPVTSQVLRHLTAPITAELSPWVIVPLFTVYFVGELVWRERDAGIAAVTDATPTSDWVPVLGKLLGVAMLLASFVTMQLVAGVVAQRVMGYGEHELWLFASVLYGLQLPEYLLVAVLVCFTHTVVQQKYLGHLLALLVFVFVLLGPTFGLQHPMLLYGAGAWWNYGEMRGFGGSLVPWAWFKAYWAGWALLLLVATRLLWSRGQEASLGERLRMARARADRSARSVAVIGAALMMGAGGWVFHNIHVRNPYETAASLDARSAAYERLYRDYADRAQPSPVHLALELALYPRQAAATLEGRLTLENRTTLPVDTVLVSVLPDAPLERLEFTRAATLLTDDTERGARVYAFADPLQPGEQVEMRFTQQYRRDGFRSSGVDQMVVANGSVIASLWLPSVGYRRDRELLTPTARRRYGLPERPVIPALDDPREREARRGTGLRFEAVVSTDADQMVAAPGLLRRQWQEEGRRYFAYATDGSIGSEWSILSARYAVTEGLWLDPAGEASPVSIRVYHHPAHAEQVSKILAGAQASLDYLTREFGPYRFGHLTVAQNPGTGLGMHADPSMLTYTEGYALMRPREASRGLDMPFAVMTHEMSHQWNVPIAFVEGAPIMGESLAWYYGMRVVEDALGTEQRQRLLQFMRQPYPYQTINRGEPLLQGLDPYQSYRKGPFALHALERYAGADPLARAMRALQDRHRAQGAPLATTRDLYAALEEQLPDSLQGLLHDLFAVNTLWKLEAQRARATQVDDEHWDVTIDVRARKQVIDRTGAVSELPFTEWVEIAVFARNPDGWRLGAPLYRQLHRVASGEQSITVRVKGLPTLAGADPFHILDWEEKEDDDNLVEVLRPAPPAE